MISIDRDIDRRIADELFGYTLHPHGEMIWDCGEWIGLPFYQFDHAASEVVARALEAAGYTIEIRDDGEVLMPFEARLKNDDLNISVTALGGSSPQALARACLLALEMERQAVV